MKEQRMNKIAAVSVFWGGLWGIGEATVGYLAHLVFVMPGIAGFIMFPMGFYFMTRAYRAVGNAGVLFSTAAVAAGIKLLDLFLPGPGPIKTINPAICILMEAAIVVLVLKLTRPDPAAKGEAGQFRFQFKEALTVSFGWRVGFLLYSSLLFVFSLSTEFVQMGAGHLARFLLLETLVNALVITAYPVLEKQFKQDRGTLAHIRPAMAAAVIAAAILLELVLI